MAESEQKIPKRRFGFHRWLIVLLIVVNVLLVRAYSPILPTIEVQAERLTDSITLPILGEVYLTNTLVATLIGDLILVVVAFVVWRATRRGGLMVGGLAGMIEMVVEGLYNLVESSAGKRARKIFPWVATIVLVVLVANWLELIPGVDSIGLLHESHVEGKGYPAERLFTLGELEVKTIVKGDPSAAELHGEEPLYAVTPFVRVASTDLNFTIALALTSVVVTQIIGLRTLGPGYLKKFFNFGGLGRMWTRPKLGCFEVIMPFLNTFVGMLELIAEFAKILSFSFRLFGNIFAGSVLLFVIGSLVPVFAQSGVVLFELFVGLIQALVFGMLTMVFMTMATQSHDEHAEGHGAQ